MSKILLSFAYNPGKYIFFHVAEQKMSRAKRSQMMIKQIKIGLIALIGVAIWGIAPGVAHAVKTHTFACNECHRAPTSANPRAMGNLCVNCHLKTESNTVAKFEVSSASNALKHNPSPGTSSGGETSHFWGGEFDLATRRGLDAPVDYFLYQPLRYFDEPDYLQHLS
jgi:hypothetical protein